VRDHRACVRAHLPYVVRSRGRGATPRLDGGDVAAGPRAASCTLVSEAVEPERRTGPADETAVPVEPADGLTERSKADSPVLSPSLEERTAGPLRPASEASSGPGDRRAALGGNAISAGSAGFRGTGSLSSGRSRPAFHILACMLCVRYGRAAGGEGWACLRVQTHLFMNCCCGPITLPGRHTRNLGHTAGLGEGD
jgi:hypothetical protein